jgi:hypothetical protein
MREKEETTTLSHSLASFENTFDIIIVGWIQAQHNVIQCKTVFASKLSENIWSKFLA